MNATNGYQALHTLTEPQMRAVAALASGSTHEEAGVAAGVHRVTVTRWANHHPRFVAELNVFRIEAASRAAAQVRSITNLALDVIERALEGDDRQAAFRWLSLVPISTVTEASGPTESEAVVEGVRRSMPGDLNEILAKDFERSTGDAESLIMDKLEGRARR